MARLHALNATTPMRRSIRGCGGFFMGCREQGFAMQGGRRLGVEKVMGLGRTSQPAFGCTVDYRRRGRTRGPLLEQVGRIRWGDDRRVVRRNALRHPHGGGPSQEAGAQNRTVNCRATPPLSASQGRSTLSRINAVAREWTRINANEIIERTHATEG